MGRLVAMWERVRGSLWFLPSVLTAAGAGLAAVSLVVDRRFLEDIERRELWFIFGGGVEGAREILSAFAGSIITVTGVVFSVTIIALQLAATQFTPRVLRQFMSDRANQSVLGVFIATFTYTVLVQRTVRGANEDFEEFVPALSVSLAVVLVLVSIGFLIFFIDHVARSIQAEAVLERVTRDTIAAMRRVAQEDADGVHRGRSGDASRDSSRRLEAERCGYIEHVEERALMRHAEEHGLTVRIEKRVGEFVLQGEPLVSVWPAEAFDDELQGAVRNSIVIGQTRTPPQDIELGILELVDIAVKALSPSINDPTTAIMALDRVGEVMLVMGRLPPGDSVLHTGENGARLLRPRLDFERATDLAFDQIRHFGASNPAIVIKLVRTISVLATLLPSPRRPVLLRHIDHARRSAEREISDPRDLQRVVEAVQSASGRLAEAA